MKRHAKTILGGTQDGDLGNQEETIGTQDGEITHQMIKYMRYQQASTLAAKKDITIYFVISFFGFRRDHCRHQRNIGFSSGGDVYIDTLSCEEDYGT